MSKKKLYFKNEDSTHCYQIEHFIHDAKIEGLETIALIEAIPSDINDHIWCAHYGEVAEKSQCKKSECFHYSSKSGRGKCDNKGTLYDHGNEIVINILNINQP